MSDSYRTEFVQKLEAAWEEIEACLASLSESQMTDTFDEQGWNVKDHIAHLAAWEESAALLFHGKTRHQTLGIDLGEFTGENINAINAAVRERWQPLSTQAMLERFHSIHKSLMASVAKLADKDLNQPAAAFFPQTPPGESRRVHEIINANTTYHYQEHLEWIRTLGERGKNE
jgi:hypothetical protein